MATLTFTAPFSASIPNPGSTGLLVNNFFGPGTVTGVSLTLIGLDHTFLSDLDILLVSPDDRKLLVMSDVGGGGDATDATITLTDSATQTLPGTLTDGVMADGSYRPTTTAPDEILGDFGRSGSAIQHATGTGAVGFASTFNGAQSAGAWWLHVNDDFVGDAGALDSWSLTLTTADSGLNLNGTTGNDSLVILPGGTGSGTVVNNGASATFSGVDRFTFYGGPGADLLIGGTGNDTLYGGSASDLLYGGGGNDMLGIFHDDSGRDSVLDGGTGTADTLLLYYGNISSTIDLRSSSLTGLERLSLFQGTSGVITREVILTAAQMQGFTALTGSSGSGSDVVDIRMRTQTVLNLGTLAVTGMNLISDVFEIKGDVSAETITGSAGIDVIFAHGGHDSLSGGGTYDYLFGGNGNDRLAGGAGDDSLDGGSGTADVLDYGASAAGVTVRLFDGNASGGDATGDAFNGIENVTGSALNDALSGDSAANVLLGGNGHDGLFGGGGNDRLDGGAGNDTLRGSIGADSLVGGAGTGDTLDYAASAVGVVVRLFDFSTSGGEAAGDSFSGIENITGSALNDVLSGDSAANVLLGGAGNDGLFGGGGNDRLDGGLGNDTLQGSLNADTFVFGAGYGRDRVLDFTDGVDRVDLLGGLTFAQLTLSTIAGGVRVAIIATPTTFIELVGVTIAQVTAGDFV